jgi:glycosyltransferase involved in cell wall biosynthesis
MLILKRIFQSTLFWIVIIGGLLVAAQVIATIKTAGEVEDRLKDIAQNLEPLKDKDLADAKTRQEVVNLRIQNEMRGFLWNSLLIATGPMIAAFSAVVAGLIGLRKYFDERRKENEDRAEAQRKEQEAREKARLDRAATELKEAMDRLIDAEQPLRRMAGIVGLQHFLSAQMKDYHLRALNALAMIARSESRRRSPDAGVEDSIRIALQNAAGTVDEAVLQQVWQQFAGYAINLRGLRLTGRRLRGLDFRDAQLEDAEFEQCDLSGVRFRATLLKGARFHDCTLHDVDFSFADLAGASFKDSRLSGATLTDAKVLQLDVSGADLRGANLDPDSVPWELVSNWRDALFDQGLAQRLTARYGPKPRGPRVLMLMWEIPPLVAGGTWTASYHLVRNLRRQGADLTVAVPWDRASILDTPPFGCEVEVVPLGIKPPRLRVSPYGGTAESSPAHAAIYGENAFTPWSPYSETAPLLASAYQGASLYGTTGAFGTAYASYSSLRGRLNSSMALRLMDEYSRALGRFVEAHSYDVIHAHDWVTFEAAATIARQSNRPWIAHFHSIESERRAELPDPIIERIEREATQIATQIIAPSTITAARIAQRYGVDLSQIAIVPNPLSQENVPPAQLGSSHTMRIVFVGRLTHQKGPDRFAEVARRVRATVPEAEFWAFGTGEDAQMLRDAGISVKGPLDWQARSHAYADASAIVMPSRAEPFGMVVLEAMQHRVPILYPKDCGAAEVLSAGIPVKANDIEAMSLAVQRLLKDRLYWEETAQAEAEEIAIYPGRGYERRVMALWDAARSSAR